MTSTSPAPRSRSRSLRRLDVLALVALLGVAAFLCSRGLGDRTNYDEGVYLASLDALRHGQQLGSDVFASQPPGFYVLLRLIGLFAGRSIHDIRLGFLIIAVLGVAAAYFLGRELAGLRGGIAAAALVLAAPPYAAYAPHVQADPPSIALALAALAVAARWFRPGNIAGVVAAGAVAAAAISIKLLALPVVVPLAVLAWQRRLGVRAVAAGVVGALAISGALAIAYASVLPDLWRDSVDFQRASGPLPVGQSAGTRLVDYFALRTPTTWAAAAAIVAAIVFRRQLALWAFAVAVVIFLALQAPLLDHHFVLLAAAVGVVAGTSLGSATGRLGALASAVAVVTAVGGWVQDDRQIARSSPELPEIQQAASVVRNLTRPNELVVSDLPIVPYLADRREPGQLVDTSAVRFASGSLTPQDIQRARARVYVAGREFLSRPDSIKGLSVVHTIGTIKILVRR